LFEEWYNNTVLVPTTFFYLRALLSSAQPELSPFYVSSISQDPLRVSGSVDLEGSKTDPGMFGTLNILPEVPLTFVENPDLASALNRSRRDKPHISCKLCRLRKVSEPVLALLESPQAFSSLLFVVGLPVVPRLTRAAAVPHPHPS
jgi:hypothetical protein